MYELYPVVGDPEKLITTIENDPSLVSTYLANSEIMREPYDCAAVLAAADRCRWSDTFSPNLLDNLRYRMAWRGLERSQYWDAALRAVEADDAMPHETQLALESAVRAGGEVNDAGKALSGLIARRYKRQINPPTPQLLASVQTELMRDIGLFAGLDVADPDPLVEPMTQRLRQFIRGAERSVSPALANQYGESEIVPPQVWWTAKALEQFGQDSEAYKRGHKSVLHAYGRSWRFLGDPDGLNAHDVNLGNRAYERENTDRNFYDAFTLDPPQLEARLDSSLRQARTVAPDNYIESMLAAENVCAAWAAVALRQDQAAVKPIIDRHWQRVQELLEPYVLDGLSLMANGKASMALSFITLESWYDNNQKVSVFTPLYGTEDSDRREAGQAMSDYLRHVYPQAAKNPDGQFSRGYHPNAPEIGVTMAYRQLISVARTHFPSGMLRLYIDRFLGAVEGLEDHPRKVSLPEEVRAAIINQSVLKRKLERIHALAR